MRRTSIAEMTLRDLERDGVRVIWADLGERRGLYCDERRTIWLNLCMTEAVETSTLLHEAAHAHFRDRGNDPRQEARADRWAARRLISPVEYALAERLVGPHPGALAEELGVARWVVETFQSEVRAGRAWTGCAA